MKFPSPSFKISAMWMLLNRFLKNARNLLAQQYSAQAARIAGEDVLVEEKRFGAGGGEKSSVFSVSLTTRRLKKIKN